MIGEKQLSGVEGRCFDAVRRPRQCLTAAASPTIPPTSLLTRPGFEAVPSIQLRVLRSMVTE